MHRLFSRANGASSAGFSIIELMSVVAILGIIAAVGVPQYQIVRARARQAEAKNNLISAFTALQNFDAAKGRYSFCLRQVGVEPVGTQFYYALGFYPDNITDVGLFYDFDENGVGIAGRECVYAPAPSDNMPYAANAFQGPGVGTSNTLSEIESGATPAFVNATQFRLGAQGRIRDRGGATLYDAWTIDQNKNLVNVENGLP